jgi:hypothetical protein
MYSRALQTSGCTNMTTMKSTPTINQRRALSSLRSIPLSTFTLGIVPMFSLLSRFLLNGSQQCCGFAQTQLRKAKLPTVVTQASSAWRKHFTTAAASVVGVLLLYGFFTRTAAGAWLFAVIIAVIRRMIRTTVLSWGTATITRR